MENASNSTVILNFLVTPEFLILSITVDMHNL